MILLTHKPTNFPAENSGAAASDLLENVLLSLPSAHSRRAYEIAARQFFMWSTLHAPGAAFNRPLILRFIAHMQTEGLTSATINLRLAALRKFAREAAACGRLAEEIANSIQTVQGLPRRGNRAGKWLTAQQTRMLLGLIDRSSLRGKRDYALCALLFGCGLRRGEIARLELTQLQNLENRWVIADLLGKGGRIRTLAVHEAVKDSLDDWLQSANIEQGKIFRRILKNDTVQGEGLSPEAVLQIIQHYSEQAQLQNKNFPLMKPHDARRTYAKLCRKAGAQLEEIQQNLGHASLTTTEKYLGSEFHLEISINDKLDFFPH